jgi:hypothetical protein
MVVHWLPEPGGFTLFMADGRLQHLSDTGELTFRRRWHQQSSIATLGGPCPHTVWNDEVMMSLTSSGQWCVYRRVVPENVVASGDAGDWTSYAQLADHRLVLVDNNTQPPTLKIMRFSKKVSCS